MQTFTDYVEAETEADMLTGDTEVAHLVVERFTGTTGHGPAQLIVMSAVEWAEVKDDWDAEVQYDATRGEG